NGQYTGRRTSRGDVAVPQCGKRRSTQIKGIAESAVSRIDGVVKQSESHDHTGRPDGEQPEQRQGTERTEERRPAARRRENRGHRRPDSPSGSVIEPGEPERTRDLPWKDE